MYAITVVSTTVAVALPSSRGTVSVSVADVDSCVIDWLRFVAKFCWQLIVAGDTLVHVLVLILLV